MRRRAVIFAFVANAIVASKRTSVRTACCSIVTLAFVDSAHAIRASKGDVVRALEACAG